MKSLSPKQISAITKMRKKLKSIEWILQQRYGTGLSNGEILDIIRYAKRLTVKG